MDVIYPYESLSILSLYMLTNKLIFRLKSTWFAGQGKKNLLSRIFHFKFTFQIVNYFCKLFRSSNEIQCSTYTIIIANIQHNEYAWTNKVIHVRFLNPLSPKTQNRIYVYQAFKNIPLIFYLWIGIQPESILTFWWRCMDLLRLMEGTTSGLSQAMGAVERAV